MWRRVILIVHINGIYGAVSIWLTYLAYLFIGIIAGIATMVIAIICFLILNFHINRLINER